MAAMEERIVEPASSQLGGLVTGGGIEWLGVVSAFFCTFRREIFYKIECF